MGTCAFFLAELSLLFDSKEPYSIGLNSSSARVRRTGGGRHPHACGGQAEDMRRTSSAHAEDRQRMSSACVRRTRPPHVLRGGRLSSAQLCIKRFAVFLVDNHIAIGLYLLHKFHLQSVPPQ